MSENSLVTLAVVALIVSAVAAGYAYSSSQAITGFASTDDATVNITIESSADINFTTDNINFGSGRVNASMASATIWTPSGSDGQGNWSTAGFSSGLVLENTGNTNVTIDLGSIEHTNAAGFLGGTSPAYQWNVTSNEAGSCNTFPTGIQAAWNDVNASTRVCNNLGYIGADTLKIDIKLTIPADSLTGALGDTIRATAATI